MRAFGIFLIASTIALTSTAFARRIELWTYDKLCKTADTIVIATAQSTEGTRDVATEADPRLQPLLVGQNTTFKVHSVLKGDAHLETLKVLHFKKGDDSPMENGPLLIEFQIPTEGPLKDVGLAGPHYLLFLKPTSDGRFEPVSGQVDPALSVKAVVAAPTGERK